VHARGRGVSTHQPRHVKDHVRMVSRGCASSHVTKATLRAAFVVRESRQETRDERSEFFVVTFTRQDLVTLVPAFT